MTVLMALQNLDSMTFEEIVSGFENLKAGVKEFFDKDNSVLEIRLFMKDKFDMDLPYFVKDEVEFSAYVKGYVSCMSTITMNGLVKNNQIDLAQARDLFHGVMDYADEFTKIVTNAIIEAYNRKDLGVA